MENLQRQTLRSGETIVFTLKNSFSYIKIKRINIPSLVGVAESTWSNYFNSFNLIFSYSDKTGNSKGYSMNLGGYISPMHRQPVIEFLNFLVPEENVKNISTYGNYYKELKIFIEPIDNNTNNIELDIFYESSPGVVLSNA